MALLFFKSASLPIKMTGASFTAGERLKVNTDGATIFKSASLPIKMTGASFTAGERLTLELFCFGAGS